MFVLASVCYQHSSDRATIEFSPRYRNISIYYLQESELQQNKSNRALMWCPKLLQLNIARDNTLIIKIYDIRSWIMQGWVQLQILIIWDQYKNISIAQVRIEPTSNLVPQILRFITKQKCLKQDSYIIYFPFFTQK